MTEEDVAGCIEALVRKYEGSFDPPIERLREPKVGPTRENWAAVEAKFGCGFPREFVCFIDQMAAYHSPGLLEVAPEKGDYDDPGIAETYDHEMSFGRWNPDLIPFLDVGNGDYFCLAASEGEASGVFYVYHEDNRQERLTQSFAEWLDRLEYFLNGEEFDEEGLARLALEEQGSMIETWRNVYAGWLPRK